MITIDFLIMFYILKIYLFFNFDLAAKTYETKLQSKLILGKLFDNIKFTYVEWNYWPSISRSFEKRTQRVRRLEVEIRPYFSEDVDKVFQNNTGLTNGLLSGRVTKAISMLSSCLYLTLNGGGSCFSCICIFPKYALTDSL